MSDPSRPGRPVDGRRSGLGAVGLVGAAFFWGSTFLIVKGAVDTADPVAFLAVRFLIGAAVLAPLALRRPPTPGELRHGVLAGLALLVGYVLQTVGLQHTSSSASAFITYLLVVFVPLLHAIGTRRWPSAPTLVAVALALAGLLLLSGGPGHVGVGEVLTLGCALAFAVHLLVLDRVTHHHDVFRLTFWQVLTVGVLCLGPGALRHGYGFDASVWWAAAACGVGATAAAFALMVWSQRHVAPSRAALILLMEPVFAAILGYLAGDRLGVDGAVGAALIVVAIVVSEVLPLRLTPRSAPATLATAGPATGPVPDLPAPDPEEPSA